MKISKYSFTLFFIILFIATSFSQNKIKISGNVKDYNNENLIGANIYLKKTLQGTSANKNGEYLLLTNKGVDTIIISFVGYKEINLRINKSNDTIINFILEEYNISTDEIIITSEKKDKNIRSTEVGTIDIDIEKIKTLPVLLGEVDPLKTLQLLPGVQNSVEGSSGMYVRGGNIDQNLLLLDDAIIYNPSHLMGFFSVFNANAIKKIKLIKGGMPANYGGRLASILDISTKEGDMKKFKAEGGIGLISSKLTLEGPLLKNKLSVIFSIRRTYIDQVLKQIISENNDNSSVLFNPTGYYFYDSNFKMNYKLNKKNQISLNMYKGEDIYSLNQSRISFNNSMKWGNFASSLKWKHLFNDKLFAKTSLAYSEYQFEFDALQNDYEFHLFSGIKDITTKTDFSYIPNSKHNIHFGGTYIFHTFIPNNTSAKTGELDLDFDNQANYYARDAAIYISDDFEINNRIKINAGLRLTHFQQIGPYERDYYNENGQITDSVKFEANEPVKTYVNAEPRASLRYSINDKSSFKMSYTQNYQYIHLATVSSIALPTDIWIPSTSQISPQFGTQYSFGYFKNFKDNLIETSFELFYKELHNQIELKEDLVNNYFASSYTIENNLTFGKGKAYGLEVLLQKQKGNYSGWISYTLAKTTRIFPEINEGLEYPAKYDRRHDLSVVMSKKIGEKWNFSVIFKYTSGNALTLPVSRYIVQRMIINEYSKKNAFRMPDYHRMDVSLTYSTNKSKRIKSSWIFAVYNVYNRQNPFYIFFDAEGNINNYQLSVQAKQVTLFPILPSITWNFKF